MRGLALLLCALCFAWGMDEADVERDIAQTRSVEALSLKMHDVPKEYRHRYVEAIKALVAQENEEKRNAMLNSLTGKGRGGHGQGSGSGNSGGKGGGNGNGGGGGRGGK